MGRRSKSKLQWLPAVGTTPAPMAPHYNRPSSSSSSSSASSSPLACEICRNPFSEDHLPRILRCSHTFCTHCLQRTISSRKRACPTCQEAFMASSAEEIMINRNLLAVAKRLLSVRKVPEITGPIELEVSFMHTEPEAPSSSSVRTAPQASQKAPKTSAKERKKSYVRTASQTSSSEQKSSSVQTASQTSCSEQKSSEHTVSQTPPPAEQDDESPQALFEKRKAATLKASAKAQEDLEETTIRIQGLISSYDEMRLAILETNEDIGELKDMMEQLQLYNERLFRGLCERNIADVEEEPLGKKESWKGA